MGLCNSRYLCGIANFLVSFGSLDATYTKDTMYGFLDTEPVSWFGISEPQFLYREHPCLHAFYSARPSLCIARKLPHLAGVMHTELAKKMCPRLRDSACWRSDEITQPRINFFGQLRISPCASLLPRGELETHNIPSKLSIAVTFRVAISGKHCDWLTDQIR